MESKLYVYINLLFVSQGCDSGGGFGLAGVKADAFLSRLSAWLPPCPANVLPPHTPGIAPGASHVCCALKRWSESRGWWGERSCLCCACRVDGVSCPEGSVPLGVPQPSSLGVLGRGSVIQADGGVLGGMWRLRAVGWGLTGVGLEMWQRSSL